MWPIAIYSVTGQSVTELRSIAPNYAQTTRLHMQALGSLYTVRHASTGTSMTAHPSSLKLAQTNSCCMLHVCSCMVHFWWMLGVKQQINCIFRRRKKARLLRLKWFALPNKPSTTCMHICTHTHTYTSKCLLGLMSTAWASLTCANTAV